MVDHTEKMIATWRDGDTRDTHHDIMRLTLDIVAKTLFDADVTSEAGDIGEAIEKAMNRFASVGWISMLLPSSTVSSAPAERAAATRAIFSRCSFRLKPRMAAA